MTLPIERARSRRPVTWLTVLGVLLLPAIIGGVLVTALYDPTTRLDALHAAIVNDDEPVTIDDQYVPLGRQLTAGLVEGSDEVDSNLTWTVSNADDAEQGLADGTYAAVVTIPRNFSAAATSTRPGETPERATIEVTTPPDALIVDDAITAQVTQAAAALMGSQLSEVYLENVLLGFTTLGDRLGEAADGAHDLASGAASAASGAAQLPDGARQLADGASQLGGGASQLGDGAARLGGGAAALGDGASALGGGASQLGEGLSTLAAKTREGATGADAFAARIDAGAAELRRDGIVPAELSGAADQTASTAELSATAAAGVADGLAGLAAACDPAVFGADYCATVTTLADAAAGARQAAEGTSALATGTKGGLAQFAAAAPEEFASRLTEISGGVRTMGAGMTQLAGGIDQARGGADELVTGADRLAGGAAELSSGATQLADGAGALVTGASGLSDGATRLADGAGTLADGVSQLADGSGQLASGLDEAVDAVPTYTDREAKSLAEVVASPVEAQGAGSSLFGASAIPLLAALALWFGSLASFVALRAVSGRALTSRAPSIVLALRALLPAAVIGALQGLLVAIVVQLAASYDAGAFAAFAGVAVVAGVAFAAVNQALVAVFGGAGRWIAALVGVLAIATGIVSTVPGLLAGIAALLPTMPAYTAMLATLTPASGGAAGVTSLVVWGALAFAATVVAVARHRTTSARAVLTASLA